MDKKNDFNIWIWIIVALVILCILLFVFKGKQTVVAPAETPNTSTTTATTVPTPTPDSVQDTTVQTSGVGTISISYANALVKYATRRIQLDSSCQAQPNTVTYKDNTGIMIDNRSSSSRTVKVGTTFTIKPYGFAIIVLPDVYLRNKTILVDCDKSQNVATILVQE